MLCFCPKQPHPPLVDLILAERHEFFCILLTCALVKLYFMYRHAVDEKTYLLKKGFPVFGRIALILLNVYVHRNRTHRTHDSP